MKNLYLIVSFLIFTGSVKAQNCQYSVDDPSMKKKVTKEAIVNKGENSLVFRLSSLATIKTFNINLFINKNVGCFQNGNEVTLTLDNDLTITLKNVGTSDCGDETTTNVYQYATVFFLNEEVIKSVTTHKLKRIRIQSTQEQLEFEIRPEHQEYFAKSIKCIY